MSLASFRIKGLTVPTALSVGVHVLLVLILATRASSGHGPRPPISVEIVTPPKPAEVAAAPVPPAPVPPPTRIAATLPKPAAPAPAAPATHEPPTPVVPTPVAESTTTTAGDSPVVLPTSPHVPTAMPTSVIGRSSVVAADTSPPRGNGHGVDLGSYTNALGRAIARHRHYPEMAAQMGQEGVALVLVHVRRDGSIDGAPRIAESSGFDLLDKEAIAMVGRAAPFAALPEGYQNAVAELRVPVRFHLED